MKLTYTACFYPCEKGTGYTVEIPDLPGCVTEGDTMADAIMMAEDAACGWVLDELEEGNAAPQATSFENIEAESGGFKSIIVLDMDTYAEKYGKNAVRKNLTIPAWLNTFAENNGINFSQILQEAIKAKLNLL